VIKEPYIKPEVKSEILAAEVLNQNWGSGGGNYGGGGGHHGGGGWGGFWWWCP
jgi:hypothetical protein